MKSNTDKKYDINNELVLRFQQGDDSAFTELFNLNRGLTGTVLDKYTHVKLISDDTMESACYLGFINAVKTFDPEKEAKFSTYCIKVMEREIYSEISFIKSKHRDKLIKKSESMNAIIEKEGYCTEKITIMNLQEDDEYFTERNKFIEDAMIHASNKSQFEHKSYLPLIIEGEITMQEVASIAGESRQFVYYHLKQYTKNARKYLSELNLNSIEDFI